MQRREFLRTSAVLVAGGVAYAQLGGLVGGTAASAATKTTASGVRYRGTSDGKVYVSTDGGQTWTLHTDFGAELPVKRVGPNAKQRIVCRLTSQGHPFSVVLGDDAKTWFTN